MKPFTREDCCRTMYQPVPNGGFDNEGLVAILKSDILKPEFQKYDCRYSPRTKTYEYYD